MQMWPSFTPLSDIESPKNRYQRFVDSLDLKEELLEKESLRRTMFARRHLDVYQVRKAQLRMTNALDVLTDAGSRGIFINGNDCEYKGEDTSSISPLLSDYAIRVQGVAITVFAGFHASHSQYDRGLWVGRVLRIGGVLRLLMLQLLRKYDEGQLKLPFINTESLAIVEKGEIFALCRIFRNLVVEVANHARVQVQTRNVKRLQLTVILDGLNFLEDQIDFDALLLVLRNLAEHARDPDFKNAFTFHYLFLDPCISETSREEPKPELLITLPRRPPNH